MAKSRKKKGRLWILLLIIALLLVIFYWDRISILVQEIPYQQKIEEQAQLYGLEPSLLAAVIKTESNFYPQALSAPGARGLMQIMPQTGQWAAETSGIGNFSEERLFEAEYNLELGSWYLAYLRDEFEGNLTLALASYNGGSNKVSEWLAEGVWDGSQANLEQIPYRETRQFVEKIYRYQGFYQLKWPD